MKIQKFFKKVSKKYPIKHPFFYGDSEGKYFKLKNFKN